MNPLLTAEQIEFYRENGFLKVENALTPQEIEELDEAMTEAMAEQTGHAVDNSAGNAQYRRVLNQKVNTWRDHGIMARYALHPRLAQMAMELCGGSGVRLFHDHALWKMSEDSKPTPWHQDFPYWPMNEPGPLSAWIPVQDVTPENGCLSFVPGSYKIGKLTGIDLANPQDIFEYARGTVAERTKPVNVLLRKGDVTFHHGLTFHYGHANTSPFPRKVLAVIYMPDGTTYNGKSHICTDGLGLEVGKPIRGGLFPLLARR